MNASSCTKELSKYPTRMKKDKQRKRSQQNVFKTHRKKTTCNLSPFIDSNLIPRKITTMPAQTIALDTPSHQLFQIMTLTFTFSLFPLSSS
jgi:hypothetical protein